MKTDETQFGTMLHALQERAKELNCLYQVGELLSQSTRPLEEIFRGIIEVLPPGWQYPHDCQARILFENLTIQPPDFQATRWVQKADIVVQGETLGAVEVFYRRDLPRSDEGPFLKEERKLIGTIAERIASSVTQRRLRAAFEGWAAADASIGSRGLACRAGVSARNGPRPVEADFTQINQSPELERSRGGQGTPSERRGDLAARTRPCHRWKQASSSGRSRPLRPT